MRNIIAKVIAEELPWLEEDCLEFAGKIVKALEEEGYHKDNEQKANH